MAGQEQTEAEFNTATSRLLRREALRRAAEELNPMSAPGMEGLLSRISAEVTADALARQSEQQMRDRVGGGLLTHEH